mgnify:CR=1 FL=1
MEEPYDNSTTDMRESVFSKNIPNVVHEKFLDYVGKTSNGGRILDIGTGNGYILREIKKRFPERYELIGVDSSPSMIDKARSADKSIEYLLADNNNLPFNQGHFSTATAKNVTRFSAEELARVLQVGGLFIFREYGERKGLVEITKLFPDRLIRSRKPDYYVTQLNKAGFENISIEQFILQRQYTQNELLKIVQMFPFIEDLGDSDLEKIKDLFIGKEFIEVTSDPFILTARRKNDKL